MICSEVQSQVVKKSSEEAGPLRPAGRGTARVARAIGQVGG